jgi:hypothetical protein
MILSDATPSKLWSDPAVIKLETIGTVELIEQDPNYGQLTKVQADLYRLLKAIAPIRDEISVGLLMELLNLKRPEPLLSRLNHLQEKGLLRIHAKVAIPA